MNYLAIDTSGKNLTVVLYYNEKKYIFDDNSCGVRHSERLMPTIENILNESGADLSKIDFFACGVGAGSFTGIRIAVATIKALAMANNKKVLSITSFDSLAYNKGKGNNLAVINAGHDGFYVAKYQGTLLVEEPKYILKDELSNLSKIYTLLSDEEIEGFNVEVQDKTQGFIKAIELKQDSATDDLDSLVPLYVRKSQAEEGR